MLSAKNADNSSQLLAMRGPPPLMLYVTIVCGPPPAPAGGEEGVGLLLLWSSIAPIDPSPFSGATGVVVVVVVVAVVVVVVEVVLRGRLFGALSSSPCALAAAVPSPSAPRFKTGASAIFYSSTVVVVVLMISRLVHWDERLQSYLPIWKGIRETRTPTAFWPHDAYTLGGQEEQNGQRVNIDDKGRLTPA